VALLRLSGPDAHAIACELFTASRAKSFPKRRCLHGHVRLADGTPDEATCTLFSGPASFTGEDVAELGVHGNPWIVAALIERCRSAGARVARPGEFSYRAWLNGRIDLTRAEALDALVRAASPAAASEAARQAAGGLSAEAGRLRGLLLDALAELEAAVDFHDDSVGQRRIDESLARAEAEAARWVAASGRARRLEEGLRVVLSGPPNAGKSSLFNALLAAERAIVTDEPGTTRDVLEGHLVLGQLPVVLLDTAGDREAPSLAEAEGLRRAQAAREGADLVLEVRDATRAGDMPEPSERSWSVLNKADLLNRVSRPPATPESGRFVLSALEGTGVDVLLEALEETAREQGTGEGAVLLAARQREVAGRLHAGLRTALADRAAGQSEELVAEGVRAALDALAELLGARDPEAVYERVFSRFCIGK
jgi:tRNA modification GTPase